MKILAVLFLLFIPLVASAKIKVASLHPVLTGMAKKIGGDKVEVIGLIGAKQSVHEFNPQPSTLKKANGAVLYLAAGKGLESYLPRLKTILNGSAKVLEVGRGITSITVSKENALFACCPTHNHGTLDPHWWNSIKNLRRATLFIATALADVDPANKAFYKKQATSYRKELDQLNVWVKKQVATIPRSKRYLATSHAAYAYFCRDYKFKSVPIQGLNKEHEPTADYMGVAIKIIREKRIKSIFPERGNNPKALKVIADATGAKVGGELIPDGIEDIEFLFKNNVNAIVKGLK